MVVCNEDGLDHGAPWVVSQESGGPEVWSGSWEAVLVLLRGGGALVAPACTSDGGGSGTQNVLQSVRLTKVFV